MNKRPYLDTMPDANGYFGQFGGAFIPPQLEQPDKWSSQFRHFLAR